MGFLRQLFGGKDKDDEGRKPATTTKPTVQQEEQKITNETEPEIKEQNILKPVFGTVTFGNQEYKTIKIGSQEWLAENLNVEHYRNGDPIPQVQNADEWKNLTTGAWCYYNNDPVNGKTYGKLYNWFAVDDPRGLAPAGWHVPTDFEWKQLEMYLGMSQSEADDQTYRGTCEGGKLKETGTSHWASPNTGATNVSGFTARPGGWRYCFNGNFLNIGNSAYFWSASEGSDEDAWDRELDYGDAKVDRDGDDKQNGFSVRLMRD